MKRDEGRKKNGKKEWEERKTMGGSRKASRMHVGEVRLPIERAFAASIFCYFVDCRWFLNLIL